MVILLSIVAVGYVANRSRLMDTDFDRRLSSLIIDLTCPALILSSVMGDSLPDRRLILPLLCVGFTTYLLLMLMAVALPHIFVKKTSERGIYSFMLMFANVGFLGYPVVSSLFGHEAVFYASLLNVPNTLFVFAVGEPFVKGGAASLKHFDWKILLSPALIASYLSMLIVAIGWEAPEVIAKPLTLLGGITVPGALLIIGSSMATIDVRKVLGDTPIYIMSILRLCIIPVAVFFFFQACSHFIDIDSRIININTVLIGMPVASFGTMFCLRFHRDETEMVRGTLLTTLLSVISIPLISLLF